MSAVRRPTRLRPRGLLKGLVRPLATPEVFDFWASRLNPAWSWNRPLARIVARQDESCDAVTLLLRPNRHCGGIQPGQHLNVSAEIDGVRVTRSYSLSDTHRTDGRIAITVKAIPGGKLSQHLCRVAKVGDVLDLGPAFGEMVLSDTAAESWLFLAAGSGITPLMAMTRDLAARGMPAPLTLLYWARTRDELCFVDELRELATKYTGFRVQFLLTRDTATADDEREGRICDAQLSALAPDLAARRIYACGPGGFVDAARTLTAPHAPVFQAEAFTPPQFADSAIEDSGTVQVTLAASRRTLTLPRGQSLLKALEAEGLKPASGCRMGICNTCACGKRSGTTRHLHTGDVEHEPVSALRLCVNAATSDLVLEL